MIENPKLEHGGHVLFRSGLAPKFPIKRAVVLGDLPFATYHPRRTQHPQSMSHHASRSASRGDYPFDVAVGPLEPNSCQSPSERKTGWRMNVRSGEE